MTAGRGISHSEISTPGTRLLHGAQLWIALPDGKRATEPDFEHYATPMVQGEGWTARVFLGSLLGKVSPVVTHTPLLGAEVTLAAGVTLELEVDASYEHAVLLDVGDLTLDGTRIGRSQLAFVPAGSSVLRLAAAAESRILLIGGAPLGERIVMWWNFVGRDHEEIVGYRREWQALLAGEEQDRFALPDDDRNPNIPAPELPHNVRLTPR